MQWNSYQIKNWKALQKHSVKSGAINKSITVKLS